MNRVSMKEPYVTKFDYPLLFKPIPVPKVWAGTQLARIPGRAAESGGAVGESWDVSTWPSAPDNPALRTVTQIVNGPLAGTPLDQVTELPVVVKVIDSGDRLSVQNHPVLTDLHKNEMWYLFGTEPDAYLYLALKGWVTPAQLCELIRREPADEDAVLGALVKREGLKRGEHFNVPTGTVHALGPGLLTFEISERSQVTYRLYDYNRERSRGKLDLVDGCKAVMAIRPEDAPLEPGLVIEGAKSAEVITEFPSFCVVKATGDRITVASSKHKHLVTASAGDIALNGPTPEWSITLGFTFTCLVPATDQPYTIDMRGSGEVLISPLNV